MNDVSPLMRTEAGIWLLDDGNWLRPTDIAEIFGVAPVTVGTWQTRGLLPEPYIFAGRRLRRREDIIAWGKTTHRLHAGR